MVRRYYDKIEVAATFNLILNAGQHGKKRCGAALCYDFGNLSDALEFVPLSPKLETGTVLAWKKDQTCSPAADQFLDFLKNADLSIYVFSKWVFDIAEKALYNTGIQRGCLYFLCSGVDRMTQQEASRALQYPGFHLAGV